MLILFFGRKVGFNFFELNIVNIILSYYNFKASTTCNFIGLCYI